MYAYIVFYSDPPKDEKNMSFTIFVSRILLFLSFLGLLYTYI